LPAERIRDYEVVRKLGRGGMGTVYLGRHVHLGSYAALKVLLEHYADDESVRSRFINEARILNDLRHPNIVEQREFFQEGDHLVMVMEYVEGRSLDRMIGEEYGPIPHDKALPLFLQILEGIAYAHSRGVIHRDIKPSNVLVSREGQAKITDLGIAKIAGQKGLTRTGAQMGTLYYESPEQIRGAKDVDHRADIYSLGMTLYEMLAGRLPFDTGGDTSEFEITQTIVFDELPSPSTFYPHIPNSLVEVVRKATAKEPDQRFQNCEELKHALESGFDSPSPAPEHKETSKEEEQQFSGEMPESTGEKGYAVSPEEGRQFDLRDGTHAKVHKEAIQESTISQSSITLKNYFRHHWLKIGALLAFSLGVITAIANLTGDSESRGVEDSYNQLVDALEEQDGQAAFDLLSENTRDFMDQLAAAMTDMEIGAFEGGGDMLDEFLAGEGFEDFDRNVERVTIEEDVATLYTGTETLTFVKEGDTWRADLEGEIREGVEEDLEGSGFTADSIMMTAQQLMESDANRAIGLFRLFLECYPDHERAYQAQFLIGFTYSEYLGDYEAAAEEFQAVIDNYSNSDMADDAEFMLEHMQTPPQSLVP